MATWKHWLNLKWIRRSLLIAIFVTAAVGTYRLLFPPAGIRVELANLSGTPVDSWELTYAGGAISAPFAGNTQTLVIFPRSESDLSLRAHLADGSQRNFKLDVYFEEGYRGDIHAQLQKDLSLRWDGHISGVNYSGTSR